jgi:hypothetical protein
VRSTATSVEMEYLPVVRHDDSTLEARRFAELAVKACDAESRVATAMVVIELAENIVKYGAKDAHPVLGTISISVTAEADGSVIRIYARNRVDCEREARDAERLIRQTADPDQIGDVYRTRFAELLAEPDLPRTQLGLLRAVAEGGFRLSCSYEPPVLVIVAERRCQSAAPR